MSGVKVSGKPLQAMLIAAVVLAVVVGLILYSCDGHLIYTLDDPYIHLALANRILHGGTYGINPGVPASPSSSILWPWLMVAGEEIGLGTWTPLVLNAIAALASVFVGMRMLMRFGYVTRQTSRLAFLGWTVLTMLAVSAPALPLTGLEHCGHVLCCLLALEGMIRISEKEAPGPAFWCALVLLPLIRFEGAGMAALAVVLLFLMGYRRGAAVIFLILCAEALGWVWFTHEQGLPLLPGSVLLKSSVAASATGAGGIFHALAATFDVAFHAYAIRGRALIVSLLFLALYSAVRRNRRDWSVYLFVGIVILFHLFGGSYGWFYRYEVYVFATTIFGLLWLVRKDIQHYLSKGWGFVAVFCFLAIGFVYPYLEAVVKTPSAAVNIYQQQYQMRRFAQDYLKAPVAVNDLGLVAYENPHFVLDMVGLGSEKVRRLRMTHAYDTAALEKLIRAHHVDFAMAYDSWFDTDSILNGGLPKGWTKVAVLHCHRVVSAGADVAFYVTGGAVPARIKADLQAFQATLPKGASLRILPAGLG